ncbi:carbohydrate binding domain-containing protein [Serinicoccus chungangensis]|uniref:carbohydrate binding domain-containing protein n=1 Tax=Serinicoccus chungangensis TaxID=767452 RepID=UPI00137B4906|nr:carbohydrate binding domain-containing protein [Serinicoccus chungangensis]
MAENVSIASDDGLQVVGPELVVNGSFDADVRGWKTNLSSTVLESTDGGRGDTRGAMLSAPTTENVVLNDLEATVVKSSPLVTYRASAWVRLQGGGEVSGQIRVREVGPSSVSQHRQAFALTSKDWTHVTMDLQSGLAGSSFDLNVMAWELAPGQALVVDDVSLREIPVTAPRSRTPGGVLSNGCAYSTRGIPNCGAYFGATYGANTDPSEFEREQGQHLGIRRTFFGPGQVSSAVRVAKSDLAAGRLPWISFKLPHSWEDMSNGKGDAWVRELVSQLDELDGPVWLAFHHEPEGDGPIREWVAMQQRLSPMVRDGADNVGFTIIVTGWHQLYGEKQYSFDSIWPGDEMVDVLGVDIYQHYGTVKNGQRNLDWVDMGSHYFQHVSAFARKHGTDWALAETGYTEMAHSYRPNWMRETYKSMVLNDGIAFSYFNTWLNNEIGTWHLRHVERQDAFGAVLRGSPHMVDPSSPPPPPVVELPAPELLQQTGVPPERRVGRNP